ncbi:MAG: leucine-rich repeat domain-containing protein [Lachnospiraceae bacterium]|nr:leucine-rich repeat domain-containing protein [Lachnospiraceae bacterium]
MNREADLEIEGGKLRIGIQDGEVTVLSIRISQSRVVIPDMATVSDTEGEVPITRIERKAFLSCRQLREISLPEQLREIGDWAFAYCSNLTNVWLPRRSLLLGKGVFKECNSLSGVFYLDGHSIPEQQSGILLGTVPVKLEAEYLFTPGEAGSRSWIARYDAKLQEFLNQPDEDGYTRMVYCGEEDIMANMDLYLAERRRAKSRLCFLRLINSVELEEEFRQELIQYLRTHTKGCESEAAWEVVYEEHGSEQEYYEIFTEAGCVTETNYDAILSEMGDQYPEMKGFLMRYHSEKMDAVDFFDLLSLD